MAVGEKRAGGGGSVCGCGAVEEEWNGRYNCRMELLGLWKIASGKRWVLFDFSSISVRSFIDPAPQMTLGAWPSLAAEKVWIVYNSSTNTSTFTKHNQLHRSAFGFFRSCKPSRLLTGPGSQYLKLATKTDSTSFRSRTWRLLTSNVLRWVLCFL